DRKIATNAWTELAEIDVLTFISIYEKEGASYVICTDISKDGMLAGTSNELYAEILENTNVKLIASGGVSCIEDLYLLQDLGCEGAILGKAFYEGKITLSKLEKFINETA